MSEIPDEFMTEIWPWEAASDEALLSFEQDSMFEEKAAIYPCRSEGR